MKSPTTAIPTGIRPASRLDGLAPYSPPVQRPGITLRLDANEGPAIRSSVAASLATIDAESLRRYPDASSLEARLADRWGVDPARVVVTNGGDDAIDRLCRSVLEPRRRALLHDPTFVMIERSAKLAGGSVDRVRWIDGAFPVDRFVASITEATALVAIVSPNNPTGGVVSLGDLRRVADAASQVGALAMVDLAYIEFADTDPTPDLIDLPNVVLVRTFSKAMGLAGLRVGYAIAPLEAARWMRTVGGPYPVSAPSLALAGATIEDESSRDAVIDRIRLERDRLARLLSNLGAAPLPSQGNFITVRIDDSEQFRERLADRGVAVRTFGANTAAAGLARITLPGNDNDFQQLCDALGASIR